MADEQKHNEGKKEAADSGSMEPSPRAGLSESSLGTLLHAAMDFAACAGLVAGLSSDTPGFYKHEPFALTPSKVSDAPRLRCATRLTRRSPAPCSSPAPALSWRSDSRARMGSSFML